MLPVIVLVGRPNVGKSTLFNRLTRSRDALVADQPGLTRDRQYGIGRLGDTSYLVVDTGGLSGQPEGVDLLMEQQVQNAIDEADHILFLLDAKEGCSSEDAVIAEQLRRTGKPITLIANKSESLDMAVSGADFYALGLGEPIPVSAAHGRGVKSMIDGVLRTLPANNEAADISEQGIQVAVVGRPNVGKSTLVNRLLGEERVITFDQPGTTRDSVFIPFTRDDERYTLIDTAGVRKRARVKEVVEKYSVIKTLQAIERANVVILVLDAQKGVGEQDATLAGHVLESGCALIVVVNKWDGLDKEHKEQVKNTVERKLPFLSFANQRFISALHGSGVGKLFKDINRAYSHATKELATPLLTRILEDAVQAHQPPIVRCRRIKLRYAHQGGKNPPIIVVHGNQAELVSAPYRRYLAGRFRESLALTGTPLRVEFRSGENPYKNKKNRPTKRQLKHRHRLKKFVKRKD